MKLRLRPTLLTRRRELRRALAAFAGLVVALSWPASAAAQPKDYTKGHITEPDGRKIDFIAQSDANGSNPSGNVTINFRPDENVSESFTVTCLVTLGNESVISGVISRVSPPTFPVPGVFGVVIWSNDNDALGSPDTYSYVLTLAPQPCLTPAPAFIPVLKGGIKVFDAP
jgi:hypothetical protein